MLLERLTGLLHAWGHPSLRLAAVCLHTSVLLGGQVACQECSPQSLHVTSQRVSDLLSVESLCWLCKCHFPGVACLFTAAWRCLF